MQDIIITQQAGVVSCDFDGIKAALNATLEEYRGAVFTEDTKKDAKAVVADLRKNKKAFQDRIRDVKAEYMKPYDDFYKKASELVNMFDEPIDFINGQVQAFEEKRIELKKALISDLYEAQIAGCDVEGYIPLQRIYNDKWENATVKEKAIVEEMQELRQKAEIGVETIKGMKSDVEETALAMFKERLDVTECVLFINKHEQEKAAILERERERVKREEEERIRAEERQRIVKEREAEKMAQAAQEAAAEMARQEVINSMIPNEEPETIPTHDYTYQITLTPAAKDALETYMTSIGIDFVVVDDLLPI